MTPIPTCISTELIHNALSQYFGIKCIKILNSKCNMAASSSDSYNSSLIRSHVTYSTDQNENREFISVIVKVCPDGKNQPFEVTNDMDFFGREIQMYTTILPEINRILGIENLEVVSARHMHVEETPVRLIVMEDLSAQGFNMQDRRQGLDLMHCKLATKRLAEFHAASVLIYEKNPRVFSIFKQALFPGNSAIKHWIDVAIKEIISVCERTQGRKKYIDKLKRLRNDIIEKCVKATQLSSKFNVLNHGDCWTNNLLYKHDSNGIPKDVRLVDYQIGVYTSPAIDLQYFWATSPNLEVRRHHLDTFLDYYYTNLKSTLIKMKYDLNRIPKKEEIVRGWYSRIHYGFAAAVTVLALTKCDFHGDASVATLLNPTETHEGSFRQHVFNNVCYWEHLEHILDFFDGLNAFHS